jgi:hypothetical protein
MVDRKGTAVRERSGVEFAFTGKLVDEARRSTRLVESTYIDQLHPAESQFVFWGGLRSVFSLK